MEKGKGGKEVLFVFYVIEYNQKPCSLGSKIFLFPLIPYFPLIKEPESVVLVKQNGSYNSSTQSQGLYIENFLLIKTVKFFFHLKHKVKISFPLSE